MSHYVRSEDPVLDQSAPVPPDFYSSPSSGLEPVPHKSTRLPALPVPNLIPPPAPPAESAQRVTPFRDSLDLDAWDEDAVELVDDDEGEFFAPQPSNNPPAVLSDQSSGVAARNRQEVREPFWPVIVPGVTRELRPVAGQEPKLIPVPK